MSKNKEKKIKKKNNKQSKNGKKRRKGKNSDDSNFPEELLNKNSTIRKQLTSATTPENTQKGKTPKKPMSNAQRKATRYGSGGKKRGQKRNTSESVNDMSDWNSGRNRSQKFKPGAKKNKQQQQANHPGQANRPGKRKRQQGWSNSGGKRVKRQKK